MSINKYKMKRSLKVKLAIIAIALVLSLQSTQLLFATATTTGTLSISISGLPNSLSVEVYVVGPNSYTNMLNIAGGGSQTLTSLSSGAYTLEPGLGANGYEPIQGSYQLNVVAGFTASQTIPYIQQSLTVQQVQLVVSPSSQLANGISIVTLAASVVGSNGLSMGSKTVQFKASIGTLSASAGSLHQAAAAPRLLS